jgi:hypothetical protein
MMVEESQLERFHPLMLHNLLASVRRFEPDFYAHLCRTYQLDADRILGLFSDVLELGPGQLLPILRDLRAHQAYHDIVYLAGRNSLLMWVEHRQIRPPAMTTLATRFTALVKQLLPPFLGSASFTMMIKGSLHFIELRGSIFTRQAQHERPVCGFYCGYLAELTTLCGIEHRPAVAEVRCCAVDPEAPTCLLQVGL